MSSLQSQHEAGVTGGTDQNRVRHLSIPIAKLMHRFYEPLQLLSILNADRGPGEVDLPTAPQSSDFRMSWRRFLDDLSWLCDNRHGGETVSAVAAQSLSEGNKIWLVTKHEQSFDHLEWVVTKLKTANGSTDEEVSMLGLAIAEKSILFSRDKIKNYLRFLKVAYNKARNELTTRMETQSINLSEYSMKIEIYERGIG
jgi:hypothetical protein